MGSSAPYTATETVDTSWTDLVSTSSQTSAFRGFDRITIVAQNDDAGGIVDFRIRAHMGANGESSRAVTVQEFLARTSTDEPDALITDFEFTEYTLQARAVSGTREVSGWIYIYDEVGRD